MPNLKLNSCRKCFTGAVEDCADYYGSYTRCLACGHTIYKFSGSKKVEKLPTGRAKKGGKYG